MKKNHLINFERIFRFFKSHWVPILTLVLTGVLVWSTLESSIASKKSSSTNQKNFELAKYAATRSLCDAFSIWFWESNYKANISEKRRTDFELGYLHQWLGLSDYVPQEVVDSSLKTWQIMGGDTTIKFPKKNGKDTTIIVNKKALFFSKNYAFVKLFNMFEDAMMVDSAKLLDVPFFQNYFRSTINRLENVAKDPTTDEILYYLRTRYESHNVFIGYDYCKNNLFNDKSN